MDCPNLASLFGSQYRIAFDPAYDPTNKPKKSLDPWMMTIPCRLGIVYPHGGDWLAVEVGRHPSAHKRLEALGLKVVQDGDQEKTFLFQLSEFEAVAEIVKPRKRRRLDEGHRTKLVRASEPFRFGSESRKTEPESIREAEPVPTAV